MLARSPAIKEVCVLARVAQEGVVAGGEEVCAVVVPADSLLAELGAAPDALEAALTLEVNRLAAALAPYKRPQAVCVWREELPRTPTRKVKRGVLREMVAGRR